MSKASNGNQILRLSKTTVEKSYKTAQAEFERLASWIEVGSGNYEKTQYDGRYNEYCNTRVWNRNKYLHCNKLDCSACFISACSRRAKKIGHRLINLKEKARQHFIFLPKMVHFSMLIKKEVMLEHLKAYNDFLKFKSRTLYPTLKKMGLMAGVIVFHLRSECCRGCNKKSRECNCEIPIIERVINPHFHILGYGYLMNTNEFRSQFPNMIYVNHGKRTETFHTLYYMLRKATLWRKQDGKIYPAYSIWGWIHGSKLKLLREKTRDKNGRRRIIYHHQLRQLERLRKDARSIKEKYEQDFHDHFLNDFTKILTKTG